VADLLVITPTRGRPGRLAVMLDAALGLAEARTQVCVAYDYDDPQRAGYEALHDERRGRVCWHTGSRMTVAGWTNRMAACYHGDSYRAFASLSDDHVPATPGWDRLLLGALDRMGGGFAYGDDLLQGADLPTAVAVSSGIVAALGWMCEPSMRHYCIDNVWKDLGQGAGCLAYVPQAVIEHCHPGAGKAPLDATYAEEAARDTEDTAAYAAWIRDRMAADVATVRAACGR
jgi:hypothetical protein